MCKNTKKKHSDGYKLSVARFFGQNGLRQMLNFNISNPFLPQFCPVSTP